MIHITNNYLRNGVTDGADGQNGSHSDHLYSTVVERLILVVAFILCGCRRLFWVRGDERSEEQGK
jgi:hypothetical protein